MHNPEFVLENGTHKPLWDFQIQTDHQISVRRPDLVIINKKKKKKKKEREKREPVGKWTSPLGWPLKVKLKESEKEINT